VPNSSLCPICQHDRRCKLAPDSRAARCFRTDVAPAGWRVKKKHRDGGATFVMENAVAASKPKPGSATSASVSSPSSAASRLAPADSDCAYSLLISKLSLNTLHRLALRKRGLNDEQIALREYRSMPTPYERSKIAAELATELGEIFQRVPGFGYVDGKPRLFGASGLLIPIRNLAGQIVAMTVRADSPITDNKYTALSSLKKGGCSPGSPAHVPIGVTAPVKRLRLTEGHLKADIISALDSTPTVSFDGVSMYRLGIALAKKLSAATVSLALDADAETNSAVAKNLLMAMCALRDEGIALELERWPIEQGKGLDDLLLKCGRPQVLANDDAMAAAVAIASRPGVDVQALLNPDTEDQELVERVSNP
jgi:hypothetical protein